MVAKKLSLFLITFFIISVITLYSIRTILPINLENIFIKQILFYLIGFVIFFSFKNNRFIIKNIAIIYIISIIMLTLLLFFADPINNSRSWFTIPFIGGFQPSEFVKIILVIFSSVILTSKTKYKLLKVLIIFLIPSILTFLEPDTGLVIIYAIGVFSSLFCYFKKNNYLLFFIIILVILIGAFIFLYFNNQTFLIKIFGSSAITRINRILNWQNQEGYQLNNALIAMGSSGKNINFKNIPSYFPEAHTDFIFASFASSFGYYFSVLFIIIIIIFDFYSLKIAKNEENKTNKIMIIGFTSMIIYQQIQNVGMNLGLLPITGITLPFISYGGSSLISYIITLTIIKNCKKKRNKIPSYSLSPFKI